MASTERPRASSVQQAHEQRLEVCRSVTLRAARSICLLLFTRAQIGHARPGYQPDRVVAHYASRGGCSKPARIAR